MSRRRGLFYFGCAVAAVLLIALSSFHSSKSVASSSVTATFSYDSLGRLVTDSYPSNTLHYDYDNAGNRTTSSIQ